MFVCFTLSRFLCARVALRDGLFVADALKSLQFVLTSPPSASASRLSRRQTNPSYSDCKLLTLYTGQSVHPPRFALTVLLDRRISGATKQAIERSPSAHLQLRTAQT